MNSNTHLPLPLRPGDRVRLLPTRKGGMNLRAEHELEGSGRGLKILQLANPKCSEVMCLHPDLIVPRY